MKRTIAALALTALANAGFASDAYRTNAGESESDNLVKVQLADAESTTVGSSRETVFYPQLG